MRGGASVGGYYGPASHSGYGTRDCDLFLEQRWSVRNNDGATRLEPTDRSLGIWLSGDEIVSVERYPGNYAHLEEVRGDGTS